MIRLLTILLLSVLGPAALALPSPATRDIPEGPGPWVVRAWYPDRQALARWTAHSAPWQVNHHEGYVLTEVADRADYQRLLNEGFRAHLDEPRTQWLSTPRALRTIPGLACYRTVEETHASLAAMASNHPNLVELIDIGNSWEKVENPGQGYDLTVIKLSNLSIPGPKPRLFVTGGLHARELTTAELLTRFAEQLLGGYANDADVRWLLNQHEIYLLPQLNPDGRKFAEQGQLWRKNVNQAYCGATSSLRGADLNRNFPFEWSLHGGSSGDPCENNYRGPFALSEPESDAVVQFMEQLFPDVRPDDLISPAPVESSGLYLDVHSYSELVIWPWGFAQGPAPNGAALATLGRRLAWFNGYTPEQAVDLYVTDGTTTDFAYGELGVAAVAYELGQDFFESCQAFEQQILPDNLPSLRYAARVSQAPYQLPSGPELVELYDVLVESGAPALLLGRAQDDRFGGAEGVESVQAIAGGSVRLDRLDTPVLSGLLPADGNFDSGDELVVSTLDTTSMADGRHLLVAQSVDQGGQPGPGRGAWLDIVSVGSSGQVNGQILDGVTLAPIGGVAVRSERSATLSGEAGYNLRLMPGTHSLHTEVSGYLPASLDGVVVGAAASTTADFLLTPLCERFVDDAEAQIDWQFESTWGVSGEHAFSPSNAYTDSPRANYQNSSDSAMVSPPLDLRHLRQVQLSFASRCDIEAAFDVGHVEYQLGEGPWVEVHQCSGDPQWRQLQFALPELDGQDQVRLRFRLTTDELVTLDGWYVDDIRISGGSLQCQLWNGFSDSFEDSDG